MFLSSLLCHRCNKYIITIIIILRRRCTSFYNCYSLIFIFIEPLWSVDFIKWSWDRICRRRIHKISSYKAWGFLLGLSENWYLSCSHESTMHSLTFWQINCLWFWIWLSNWSCSRLFEHWLSIFHILISRASIYHRI